MSRTNNYCRCDGILVFFDDRSESSKDAAFAAAISARKACVWRRPTGREWLEVKVIGE